MKRRKLPAGIQSFSKLCEQDCYYVDKTAHIHRLVTQCNHCFLSRPRRFGKSLLVASENRGAPVPHGLPHHCG